MHGFTVAGIMNMFLVYTMKNIQLSWNYYHYLCI